jgi:hypothetical protein
MPYGLTSSPATFMRLMNVIFCEYLYRILLVYLDDILVFAKTVDEQIERLGKVLQRLRETGLKVEPSKCHLFCKEVNYLGHIISSDGIATDPAKIKTVTDWPIPKSASDVRSFLGLASYYRRYIPKFTQRAAPLQELIREDPNQGKRWKPGRKWKKTSHAFVWNETSQEAFDNLKKSFNLCSSVSVC